MGRMKLRIKRELEEKARQEMERAEESIPQEPEAIRTETPESVDSSEHAAEPLPKRDFRSVSSSARLSIPVRNGKVDFVALRPDSKKRLAECLAESMNDPEFRKIMGMPADSPESIISPEVTGMILDCYAAGEAFIYNQRLKLEWKEAQSVAEWGITEKELLKAQGTHVINKYVPARWRQRLDLFFFFGLLFSLSMRKFSKAASLAEEKSGSKKEKAQAPIPIDRQKATAVQESGNETATQGQNPPLDAFAAADIGVATSG
jgi:hypothetical protein